MASKDDAVFDCDAHVTGQFPTLTGLLIGGIPAYLMKRYWPVFVGGVFGAGYQYISYKICETERKLDRQRRIEEKLNELGIAPGEIEAITKPITPQMQAKKQDEVLSNDVREEMRANIAKDIELVMRAHKSKQTTQSSP